MSMGETIGETTRVQAPGGVQDPGGRPGAKRPGVSMAQGDDQVVKRQGPRGRPGGEATRGNDQGPGGRPGGTTRAQG